MPNVSVVVVETRSPFGGSVRVGVVVFRGVSSPIDVTSFTEDTSSSV